MSPWTRYSYLAVNPFVGSGGIKTVECEEEDFSEIAMNSSISQDMCDLQPFSGVKAAELPEECPTAKELQERSGFFFFQRTKE